MTEMHADTSRTLVMERSLPHSPEKVWRALTEGALLEEWLMKTDFRPVAGHAFTFRTTPHPPYFDGVIAGRVLEAEAPARLAYTWSASGVDTTVRWTLTPVEGGVLLRFEQAGLPAREANFQGAVHSWTGFLDALERVLPRLDA